MATNVEFAVSRIASVNPATGEVLGELDSAGPTEVRAAVARARAAQPEWNAWGIRNRVRVLRRFQQILLAHKTDIARRITQEAGKPAVEALLTEVLVVLDAARFLIDNAFAILREEKLPHGNPAIKTKSGRILHEPYGVVGIISPWNYPFSIPATEALAALVAGNAVVLKPSELTPLIALELQALLREAGVPDDIFQVLPGEGATGAALVGSEIDKLVFTGSVATGRRIAQIAAERLLPVVLELGGKDPMLVLEDADVDVASSGAVWGAFVNAGQTCLSVERCYVHQSLYPAFFDACCEKARKLRVGNGMDPATEIGPMIHERQVRVVESQVEDARQRGARVLAGGTRLRELGPTFFAPTVLAGRRSRHARDAGRDLRPGAADCAFPRRCRGRAPGQRFRLRTGRQRLDSRSRPRRATGSPDPCRHSDGERRRVVFQHQRSSAWRREGEWLGPHAWALGIGRNGARETRRHRLASAHEKNLVVRLWWWIRGRDGRFPRPAVRPPAAGKTESRRALRPERCGGENCRNQFSVPSSRFSVMS